MLYRDGMLVAQQAVPLVRVNSNNEAEYEGLITALTLLEREEQLSGEAVVVGDSQLVIGQIRGLTRCEDNLRPYLNLARRCEARLQARLQLRYEHVKREWNLDADAVSNAAMDSVQQLRGCSSEHLLRMQEDYQRSALAMGATLAKLCDAVAKAHNQPWAPGHVADTTSLTALGGSVVRGVSRRAVLSEATQAVLRKLRDHTSVTHAATPFYAQHEAWAATFYPQEHYAAAWQQPAAQWYDVQQQRAAPQHAPLGARRNARVRTCAAHSKPMCAACRRRRRGCEECCRVHHHEADGLQARPLRG